jgi:tetratricopeptide (TPR) repeat protein
LKGERRQLRLVSAALDGLRQRLRYGPVVVVLDDLHQADDLTWVLAQRLIGAASVMGISIVLCLHDESEVPFSIPSSVERLELPPLSEGESLSLIKAGLGKETDRRKLSWAASRCEGLPLLAEEIIRTLKQGDDELIEAMESGDPYPAVDTLVLHRIRRLSPTALRVLRISSVLGLEPRQSEVLEVAGGESHENMAALVELESQTLLERASGKLKFPFPRVMDVVSDDIPISTWRELHEAAAEVISEITRPELRQLELGDHLLQAERYEEAFSALHQAGKLAMDEGQNRRAAFCLELAVDAGRELGPKWVKELVVAYRDFGQVLILLKLLDQAEQVLREGFHIAREAGTSSVGSELLRLHGRAVLLEGDLERGKREIQATLDFAEKRGDINVAAQACVDLADAAEMAGDMDEAEASLRRGLELIQGYTDPEAVTVRVQLYNRLGRLELEAGHLSRAIALFAEALELAESAKDRYQAAGLMGNLGGAYAQQQESAKALYFTERALQESEELGDQIGIARQSFNLALLRLSVGQVDNARSLLKSSYEASCRSGWHEGLAMSRAAMSKLDEAV